MPSLTRGHYGEGTKEFYSSLFDQSDGSNLHMQLCSNGGVAHETITSRVLPPPMLLGALFLCRLFLVSVGWSSQGF